MTGPGRRLVDSDAVPVGAIVDAEVDGAEVVIWRRGSDGRPCVMAARCPHQWSHLASQGAVDGDEMVCLTHQWRFTADGAGSREWAPGERQVVTPIAVYACEEREGSVWLVDDDRTASG